MPLKLGDFPVSLWGAGAVAVVGEAVGGTVGVDAGAGSDTVMGDTVVEDAIIGDVGVDTGAGVTVGRTIGGVAVNDVTILGEMLTLSISFSFRFVLIIFAWM